MDENTGTIIFFFMAILLLFSRIAAHFLDKVRIRDAAAMKGLTHVEVRWQPFARGFFTETKERFYAVFFKDKQGKSCELLCKTSMFSGISWIDEHFQGI